MPHTVPSWQALYIDIFFRSGGEKQPQTQHFSSSIISISSSLSVKSSLWEGSLFCIPLVDGLGLAYGLCFFSVSFFFLWQFRWLFHTHFIFYAPAIYNGGGHIASPLSVRPYIRTYIHTYVRTYVPYVRKMVSGRYLLNTLVYWIHISYTGI